MLCVLGAQNAGAQASLPVASAPEPAPSPPTLNGDAGPDDEGSSTPSLSWRARIITGFQYDRSRPSGAQTRAGEKEYGFVVRQIRLGAEGELAEQFRFNVSFDLSDALSTDTGTSYSSPPYLRTAVFEYRPDRSFRLTVGRFKRPFSKLELTSAADLPVLNRGLWNGLAIEDNQWGDRAVGAAVSGRLKLAKLRWYLSLTNPSWSSQLAVQGVDVLGRVQSSPIKPLTIGVNGGYKYSEIGLDDTEHSFAVGGDVGVELGEARLFVEGAYADLPFETGRPRGFGFVGSIDYRIPLTANWALLPVVFAELADANASVSQTESLRLALGVNVLGYSGFRIMPEFALTRPVGDASAANPWLSEETYRLISSLVL